MKSTQFFRIHSILLVVAHACSAIVPAAPVVDVHCQSDVMSGCSFVESLDIHEPTALNFVNADEWKNVDYIEIPADSNITVLPSGIFQQFPRLTNLLMSFHLKSMTKDDFKYAGELLSLVIDDNDLQTLPANVFEYANKLQRILASSNQLTVIEDHAFNGLSLLDSLSLHNNSLTMLRRNTFTGAPSISYLRLERNRIEAIEDGALNMLELNYLDLSHNRIDSLAEGMLNLPKLEIFLISHNRIQSLSDNVFRGAPKLNTFDIKGNGLNHIGKAFKDCNELLILDLTLNNIDDIDVNAFAKLSNLVRLKLTDSGFQRGNASRWVAKESSPWELDIS